MKMSVKMISLRVPIVIIPSPLFADTSPMNMDEVYRCTFVCVLFALHCNIETYGHEN
jgi:hypothetical protein